MGLHEGTTTGERGSRAALKTHLLPLTPLLLQQLHFALVPLIVEGNPTKQGHYSCLHLKFPRQNNQYYFNVN